MNYHIAARMDRMAPSGIRKVNEKALAMERAGEKVLHFEIGRPDFDTPAYIKKAAEDAMEAGKVHYTSNFGLMELRQAIAGKLKRENHIDYQASEVLVTVGLSEAVFAVLAALLDEGDEILVPDPVWLNYINVPSLLGAKAVTYSLKEENGYQMDLDEVREKITDKTRAVVIVTPNNPTGGVLERGVLEELAEIVKEHGLMVIADEIYERLVYDGAEHVSIASLPGMKERTFTLNGMSKAYAMDGWRLGYVAAPEEYITVMNKFHQHNTTCAPSFVQAAAIAALTQEGDEVKEGSTSAAGTMRCRPSTPSTASTACAPRAPSTSSSTAGSWASPRRSCPSISWRRPRSPWCPGTCSAPAGRAICACPSPPAMRALWRAAGG